MLVVGYYKDHSGGMQTELARNRSEKKNQLALKVRQERLLWVDLAGVCMLASLLARGPRIRVGQVWLGLI
ncbi:hypothetical protein Fmac_017732 [Flemingia macrophylla]|uniref:Uncharacterized protein n=1 Tax=Flemingia macrophylla TaxID=520843 RepID=A0ABD1M358_9FABA